MKARIKITPIRSQSLCEKCRWNLTEECKNYLFSNPPEGEDECKDCPNFNCEKRDCKCSEIEKGEPCPFFERKVNCRGGSFDGNIWENDEDYLRSVESLMELISSLQNYGISSVDKMELTNYKSQLVSNRELAELIADRWKWVK
jgi:hypothetical protein